jgi:mercuric reductase
VADTVRAARSRVQVTGSCSQPPDVVAQGGEPGDAGAQVGGVRVELANRDTRGALKLVADAATGKVLGVHAAFDGAGDVMPSATYAIKPRDVGWSRSPALPDSN